jgi:Fe2+ transport system protein B
MTRRATRRGWTVETWVKHSEALAAAERRFNEERDRRYAEVALEREKALKIKETADLAALQLAREIQTYKDEKANELRSQIERERGSYATKDDLSSAVDKVMAVVKPLADYVAARAGVGEDRTQKRQSQTLAVQVLGFVLGVVVAAFAVYAATHGHR